MKYLRSFMYVAVCSCVCVFFFLLFCLFIFIFSDVVLFIRSFVFFVGTHTRRMSLSKVLNAAAHGHIHETIGGSWNHYFGAEAQGMDREADDSVMTFAHEIQAS